MISAGLDVGSRTIKLVTLDEDVRESAVVSTGAHPLERCRELLESRPFGRLVVTGYGRHLVGDAFNAGTVSEIKACAVGARYLYPDCRTVIDVGGQDCKVTQLGDGGTVVKFEMNDRCAAGTGRFLEVMAATLDVPISQLGLLALSASRSTQISSLCTVFAESEVVSLIARGEDSAAVALALHRAVTARVSAMARRVGVRERTVFAGGGALNPCLAKLLGEELGAAITVPDSPQTVGALGAAVLARQSDNQVENKEVSSQCRISP